LLKIIGVYARDYPNLRTYSDNYPTPDYLRSISKQGGSDPADLRGWGERTEGSDWIIKCAHRDDQRPLWLLVWGGIDDLAQALRVYFIGGPNKKWSTTAYDYIAREHRDLWIIEANSTYSGFFQGGNQAGAFGNREFVSSNISGRGALGDYFATISPAIKMGDTPSLTYLFGATPENPAAESWGGSFVRAWNRPRYTFTRPPAESDTVEVYSITEIICSPEGAMPSNASAKPVGTARSSPVSRSDGCGIFVLSEASQKWSYRIVSDQPGLNG
jgi:hypothetical protein